MFGAIGIVTAMYWSLLNARIGLIRAIFGQPASDWVNAKMSLIYDIIPYIVFPVALISGGLWLGYNIYNWCRRRKQSAQSEDDIKNGIVESLNNIIELVKKL